MLNPVKDININRRDFLRLSGILGIGVAVSTAVPGVSEAVRFNSKLYKVSRTRLSMGTFVSITAIHHSKEQADDAIGCAFEEVERLVRELNRFDSGTAIGHLNKEGRLKEISPEIYDVISRALYFNRITNGYFDITVKPIVDLFKERFSKGLRISPDDKELKKALQLVGSSGLELSRTSVFFKKPGMGITLDGIAKGYIVDRASELLSKKGIHNHLINAGGDIRTKGFRKDRRPWKIAIQDPFKKRHYPDVIEMNNGAIATSGNYEVYYDKEKLFHHIVNPRTGLSPTYSSSVSIIANNAMDADAMATGVFVMEPEKGRRLINSIKSYDTLIITKNGSAFKSKGWHKFSINS